MVEVKRFSVGELAARAGVATSALRFYEANGLITSERNSSGHRRYRPDALRRVAFIRVAQRIGLSLGEVGRSAGVVAVRPHADTRRLERAGQPVAAADRRADRRVGTAARSSRRLHRLWMPVAGYVRVVQHRRSCRAPRRRCPISAR